MPSLKERIANRVQERTAEAEGKQSKRAISKAEELISRRQDRELERELSRKYPQLPSREEERLNKLEDTIVDALVKEGRLSRSKQEAQLKALEDGIVQVLKEGSIRSPARSHVETLLTAPRAAQAPILPPAAPVTAIVPRRTAPRPQYVSAITPYAQREQQAEPHQQGWRTTGRNLANEFVRIMTEPDDVPGTPDSVAIDVRDIDDIPASEVLAQFRALTADRASGILSAGRNALETLADATLKNAYVKQMRDYLRSYRAPTAAEAHREPAPAAPAPPPSPSQLALKDVLTQFRELREPSGIVSRGGRPIEQLADGSLRNEYRAEMEQAIRNARSKKSQ